MKLLTDEILYEYVNRPDPLVKDLKVPNNWLDKESPIQPSSIDLHIGSIFLPGTELGIDGSEDKPLSAHTLRSGQTALITTLEVLNLPDNIAAIGFPPSRVSAQGVLMTNPGHVDPGYKGPMHFTVINMGRQEYHLRIDGVIVTVLFFEMSSAARIGYSTRNGGGISGSPKQENINILSADFLDVERRAEGLAKEEVRKAGLLLEQFKMRERFIVALMTLLVLVAGWVGSWLTGVKGLEAKIQQLEKAQAVAESSLNFDRRLTDLENRLRSLPSTGSPAAAISGQPAVARPKSSIQK